MRESARQFIKNGISLSISALVMRTVSVAFGAYLSDRIGAEGMGLYSLIMSIYTFAVTFATSGVSLATTRLCSDALGRERPGEVRGALAQALFYAFTFGAAASVFLFFGADFFGTVLLGDSRTVPSLRLLSAALVPIAVSSVFNGYFTAMRHAVKNAAVSMAEQVVRILLTSFALTLLLPHGMTYACLSLVAGSALSEIFSALCLFLLYRAERRHSPPVTLEKIPASAILRITLPIAASSYIRSGLLSADHMLIPRALTRGGGSREEALASYGVLSGMALPVLLYPTALLSSFAGLLVPEFAEGEARGTVLENRRLCERALRLTLLFGIACGGLMTAFAGELGQAIYHDAAAGRYIAILAPVIPVMYLDHVTDAMMKGVGLQFYSMVVNILDSMGSILLVLLLLPRLGVSGYAYIIIAAEIFNFSLSVTGLHNKIRFSFRIGEWVLFPTAVILLFSTLARRIPGAGAAGLILRMALALLLYMLFLFSVYRLPGFFQKRRKRKDPPQGQATQKGGPGARTAGEKMASTAGTVTAGEKMTRTAGTVTAGAGRLYSFGRR